ncbi:MAG: carbohydrate porin, partial [Synechococcales cyanobacterium]
TPNVSVTPGIIYITGSNNNANASDVVVGAIRTRFTF